MDFENTQLLADRLKSIETSLDYIGCQKYTANIIKILELRYRITTGKGIEPEVRDKFLKTLGAIEVG